MKGGIQRGLSPVNFDVKIKVPPQSLTWNKWNLSQCSVRVVEKEQATRKAIIMSVT